MFFSLSFYFYFLFFDLNSECSYLSYFLKVSLFFVFFMQKFGLVSLFFVFFFLFDVIFYVT